ncbi:OapC/ArvC family zinc-ribbon domain-containing protein [Methanobrevibacter filiformis]|uniref:Zn-ribbon containing protein n=1 Tax=Methanobrevibacter filiformis TaxID=55758 RepID=A0A165ZH77_9EURY|nr:Zn-ribbon containing protein [Methanobrevibacter filiformis]KZX10709.1 hypothetical protein MBFIL_16210 [Methanobrevibacter filiformis]
MNVCNNCGTELHGEDVLNGCPKCGSKYFKFVNKESITKTKTKSTITNKINNKVNKRELDEFINESSIESVKVEDRGVYQLNIKHMLDGEPEVFSDSEGNYAININALLKKGRKDISEK